MPDRSKKVMKNLNIAVIEDEAITLEMITHVLETQLQATVYSFSRSKLAREFLLKQTRCSLHLIISDQHMPEYDGMALLQSCQAAGLTVPFLLVTADTSRETILKARECGADGVIAKPIETETLIERIMPLITSSSAKNC